MEPLDQFKIEPGVTVKIYPEDEPDWSWVESDAAGADFMERVRRGDVEQVIVTVSMFDKTGELEGSDSLGGIVIGIDDHKQEIRDAIDAHEMIANAKAELDRKIKAILAAYQPSASNAQTKE